MCVLPVYQASVTPGLKSGQTYLEQADLEAQRNPNNPNSSEPDGPSLG